METFLQNKLKMGNNLIIAWTEVKKWAFCVFVQLDPCKECRLFLIWKTMRPEACEPTWSHFHCFCFRLFIYKKIYCIRLSRQISRLNSPNQSALTIFGICMPIDNRFDVILLAASFPGNNTASVLQNCRTGQPSSSVDWIVLNLNNSSHHTRPHSITKFDMNWHFASLFS